MKKSKSRRIKTIIARHKAEQQTSFKQLTDIMNFMDSLEK